MLLTRPRALPVHNQGMSKKVDGANLNIGACPQFSSHNIPPKQKPKSAVQNRAFNKPRICRRVRERYINMACDADKEEKMKDLMPAFKKAYSNLPDDERSQIIVLIEGRPYTWNRAYDEVEGKTKLGEKILKKMKQLEIL